MPGSGDPLLSLVARIVIARVEHHETPNHSLPDLIRDVYQALANAREGAAPVAGPSAVRAAGARDGPGQQTVFEDHLICLECGLQMKMLKRHLQTMHRTSPAQYREKWRLPVDYPFVARQYAALRSSLAKQSGLGTRRRPRGQ